MKQLINFNGQLKINKKYISKNSSHQGVKSIFIIALCLLFEQSYAATDIFTLGRYTDRATAISANLVKKEKNKAIEQSIINQAILTERKTKLRMTQLLIEENYKNIIQAGRLLADNQISVVGYQQLMVRSFLDLNQWVEKFSHAIASPSKETERMAINGLMAIRAGVEVYQAKIKSMSMIKSSEDLDPSDALAQAINGLKTLIGKEYERVDRELKSEVKKYEANIREIALLEGKAEKT